MAMVTGLVSPKRVLIFADKPTRGKVVLLFIPIMFGLLILMGTLHESPLELALKAPDTTKDLVYNDGNLDEVPMDITKLANLTSLYLEDNKITTLPIFLKDMDNLSLISLKNNPIEALPAWISEMKNLKYVEVDGTNIATLPSGLENLTISYTNTPLWRSENPQLASATTPSLNTTEDEHAESFKEYAMRRINGQDYGSRRKFLKGEIYYNSPVTKEQADKVGEFMVTIGMFSEEKEVSMLLNQNKDQIYELKMVIDWEYLEQEPEMIDFLKEIRSLAQEAAFINDELHLHLTDDQFETKQIIKE
jgi:hypothetical protein